MTSWAVSARSRKEVDGVKSACDVLLYTIMRSVFRMYYSSCQRKRGYAIKCRIILKYRLIYVDT